MARLRRGLAAMAVIALTQAQAASAQSCVSPAEVSALFVYAMPSALESARNSCDGKVGGDGFFAKGATKLIGQYTALQNESWPKAKRALALIAGGKTSGATKGDPTKDPVQFLGSLPDNAVRPLVDAIIVQKVAEEIKPQHCRNIERVAAAIAPIEPRAAAALLGTVLSLVKTKDPQMCVAD